MTFLKGNKKWLIIIAAFILARVIVFSSFWAASADKGGWANFYGWSQPAQAVLTQKFHETCDWHPPLYYTFTSALFFLFKTQWSIYFFHLLFAFVSLLIGYKTIRLFLPEKIAFWAVLIWALEPFWAWHNFLLASENLYIPLFLAAMYFLFVFLKKGTAKHIMLSFLFFGLAVLTRPTALLIPALISVVLIFLFVFRNKIKTGDAFFAKKFKEIVILLLAFNFLFWAVAGVWMVRNKLVYDRFSLAMITATNVYYYNLPPLLALQKNISYQEAYDMVAAQAANDLGPSHVAAKDWNCTLYTNEELNKQFDYYDSESKKYIMSNLKDYVPLHLVKMAPFFIESGYFDLYSAHTGEYSKPDITAAFMKGDMGEVKEFFAGLDLKKSIYIFGMLLWLAFFASSLAAVLYSFFKDKPSFLFFALSALMAFYTAFLMSPFNFARYRLPLYVFFFAGFVYIIDKLWFAWKNRSK
ncbi:MAG: glycosyltransferase family 39 protein [Candidatus Pacebacteria bacterium]|nr:glycosyltransferase family 39 protein [Candidatus Paceibacterota bacterium]NUQ57082.1 glycosyltransferase family 39 protein [Candidatus Paceibacter sp.]